MKRHRRSIVALGALGAVAALLTAGCTPAEPRSWAGRGRAVEIDAAARAVTLEHEEIPGLMQAMTMRFEVAPEVDLAALAPGSAVEFELSEAEGELTVVALRPAPASDAAR